MFPIPVMTKYGNSVNDQNTLLDIDFGRQAVGSTSIIDAKGHIFTTLSGSGASVVYNSSIGSNVMYFPGTHSFYTPMVNSLRLSTLQFDIDCIFQNTDTTPYEVIFETGNYTQASTAVGGISLTLNQFQNQYIQLFTCTSTSYFNRVLLDGTNINRWESIKIKFRSTGITIINNTTGTTNTYSRFNIGDGNNLSIGGSYVSVSQYPYFFKGYLKSLKITKI